MKISGIQKMTLLDYPGKVACTVFLGGCNFRCPFCHNSELLGADAEELMSTEELLAFLKKRVGLLDGVCITGGEPTLSPELPRLLAEIKAMGYSVKLDTNGYRPDVLAAVVEQGLVDYVAMDVKNSAALYPQTCGLPTMNMERIEESLRYLLADHVDYELRTTVVAPLHTRQSVEQMSRWVQGLLSGKKARLFFLQPFTDRNTVLFSNLSAPTQDELADFLLILSVCAEHVELRGA